MGIHTHELPLDTTQYLLTTGAQRDNAVQEAAARPAAVLIVFPLCFQTVKFGYIKKSQRDFEEECLAIEEYEGKIHANIADLSKYCEMTNVCMDVTNPRVTAG